MGSQVSMARFPEQAMSAPRWYGGGPLGRKRGCPPFRPRTYPHLTAPLHTEARGGGQLPAMVLAEGQAGKWVLGEQEIAVEVHPVRERRGRSRRRDRHRGLFHAPEEGPEAELAGAREH